MKILIIKLGALGDVLRTTSLLPGIKKKFKESELYWITKKDSFFLLNNNPLVDKVLVLDNNYFHKLKNIYFDLVINLDEEVEACLLASRVKKEQAIGFILDKNNKIVPTETAREWYNMSALGKKPDNDELKKKNKKTYQQLMAEMIDISQDNNDIIFNLAKWQEKFASDFKRRYNISKDDVIIGFNTGSGYKWPSKMLSIEKTAHLAEKIYNELNAKILLFGGPNEIERNNKIIALANVPIINTGCGNDLIEFPALISICNLFVTSDSLGLHIALALKRKVVVFFGPTSASEIEMYNLGKKIIPKDKCYCCYKPDCKALESIKVDEIIKSVKESLNEKVSIIITSFKEPNLKKVIDSILNQDIKANYDIIVAAPDTDAQNLVKSYKRTNVTYFKDPGRGKSFALNMLFRRLKSNILVFTDADVILDKNSINEILKAFKDPIVGCACGRVVSLNDKNEINGYWSHLLADAGAHRIRKLLSNQEKFFECSAYLMAIRNNIIKEVPLDVAEDSIIPFYFYKRSYKLKYVDSAKVYVRNPDNFNDWLKQRTRTAKAHETLTKYEPNFPRVKSLKNEVFYGTFWALSYPRTFKEIYWTIKLLFARLYMWTNVFMDTKIFKKHYTDSWDRVESTK
ncbi:glycosyltransferase [Candidatus Woesearchaeota archaeon]|nr:glycosyltransferase [Candidatus Woesearchaeota archaeon]